MSQQEMPSNVSQSAPKLLRLKEVYVNDICLTATASLLLPVVSVNKPKVRCVSWQCYKVHLITPCETHLHAAQHEAHNWGMRGTANFSLMLPEEVLVAHSSTARGDSNNTLASSDQPQTCLILLCNMSWNCII